uniref:GYF domain-containing protein n=1 Tax=Bursaphelenchus xylophilus TaxID=6326 RepID=A0A1I7RYZ7_BURXY
MPLGHISYSREDFLALKCQAHEALLPQHMSNAEYLNADGQFVPDKYVEGMWRTEKGSGKKKTDIPDAFSNGSSLSPQRRGFSSGCKEVSSNDDTSLRRRALNNNLPAASQNSKRPKNGLKTSNTLSFNKKFGRKDEKNEEMPEWMDGGPTDHNEIITLGGFEEDQKASGDHKDKPFNLRDLMKKPNEEVSQAQSSVLPDSDLEFAAQFGLLDVGSISKPALSMSNEAPKQSRLSQFFSEKPKESPTSTLPPAVAMLLKGARGNQPVERHAQAMDERTLLDHFAQRAPEPLKEPEEDSWDADVEELKKVLSDYTPGETITNFDLKKETPKPVQSTQSPPVQSIPPQTLSMQGQPVQPPPAPGAPFLPMPPNMPRMPQMGLPMVPGPNGFPMIHPAFIAQVEHWAAAGQLDLSNPRVESMLNHIKYQKQLMGVPNMPFMPPMPPPSSSGERSYGPPSSMPSSRSSPAPTRMKPAFDLVPTAVMLQQTKQQHKEDRETPGTLTDKSRSGSNSSLAGRRPSNPPEMSQPMGGMPSAPQMNPSFMGPPPSMGPFGPGGYAQMGMHVFPIPHPIALQMDAKRLQEAQQRGDAAAVAYLQNSIQTQLQALSCLQNAAAQNMGHAPPMAPHPMASQIPRQSDSPFNRPSNESPMGSVHSNQSADPFRQQNPGLPTVFQKLTQFHDQQRSGPSNLSILNKLPPHVRPMTVEELEKQLASS